jgi:hypothetical protein
LCKPFFFLLVDSFEESALGAAAGAAFPGPACEEEEPEPDAGTGCVAGVGPWGEASEGVPGA